MVVTCSMRRRCLHINLSKQKRTKPQSHTGLIDLSESDVLVVFIYQDKLHHNHHDGGPRLMFSSGSRSINMHSNWGMINAMRSKAPVIRCSANSCLLDYFPEAYFHLWTLLLHCYSIDWAELFKCTLTVSKSANGIKLSALINLWRKVWYFQMDIQGDLVYKLRQRCLLKFPVSEFLRTSNLLLSWFQCRLVPPSRVGTACHPVGSGCWLWHGGHCYRPSGADGTAPVRASQVGSQVGTDRGTARHWVDGR
jgi:hypothetical protein